MKKILRNTLYIVLAVVILQSCHNLIYEDAVVISKEVSNVIGYDYKYKIDISLTYDVYYTDKEFNVGDTITFCNNR